MPIFLNHFNRLFVTNLIFIYLLLSVPFWTAAGPFQQKRQEISKKGPYNTINAGKITLLSDLKRGKIRKFSKYITAFQDECSNIYPINAKELKSSIYIFKDRKGFFKFVKLNKFHTKYAGGFYSPSKNLIALYYNHSFESTLSILLHEMAHLYTQHSFKMLPQSLNEGISEYIENSNTKFHNFKFGLFSKNHYKLIQRKPPKSLEDLIAIRGYGIGTHHEIFGETEYAQSWALVWYLLNGPNALKAAFKKYLIMVQNKNDFSGELFLKTVPPNKSIFIKEWMKFLDKSSKSLKQHNRKLSLK